MLFIGLILDQASEEKKRLEEKQRAARKNRSKSEEDWKTRCVTSSVWLSHLVGYCVNDRDVRHCELQGKGP